MSKKFIDNINKCLAVYKSRKHPKYGFGPAEAYAIESLFFIKHSATGTDDPVGDANADMKQWMKEDETK